jgi:hypothetical protein
MEFSNNIYVRIYINLDIVYNFSNVKIYSLNF